MSGAASLQITVLTKTLSGEASKGRTDKEREEGRERAIRVKEGVNDTESEGDGRKGSKRCRNRVR